MFVRIYDSENDRLIPRDGRSDHWDLARVPNENESLILWIDENPVSYIVDDVVTECDGNRVNYSINVTSLANLGMAVIDNGDTTAE